MLLQGFTQSKSDSSLFIKQHEADITLVLVYVDDIIVTGSNMSNISTLISDLDIKLGPLHYFLGIEVLHYEGSLILSQTKYANDIFVESDMIDCKPSQSPSSTKPTVFYLDPEFSDVHWLRQVMGFH